VVGATNRNVLGTNHRNETYFVDAQRAKDTIFTVAGQARGGRVRFPVFPRGDGRFQAGWA
jgi:hypothetical protein